MLINDEFQDLLKLVEVTFWSNFFFDTKGPFIIYTQGGVGIEGGYVKFILCYGRRGILSFLESCGVCRKTIENIVAPVYL
jgi:hypothetical protein